MLMIVVLGMISRYAHTAPEFFRGGLRQVVLESSLQRSISVDVDIAVQRLCMAVKNIPIKICAKLLKELPGFY
jgi:hypothetical protein